MPRKQTIIIFPHLNDCGGDLEKDWYVEWKYRIPGDTVQKKERTYKGLNKGTLQERYQKADEIIKDKTQWLKSGAYLNGSESRVYEDELMYRNEAQIYGKAKESVVTFRTHFSEFLQRIKYRVSKKTYETYCSKIRIFNSWLEINKMYDLNIKNMKREHIIKFTEYLVCEKGLSRLSIEKYIQIIRAYFEYEIEQKEIEINPVERIPKIGKLVDMAPAPFTKDERTRLKNAITKHDPQLWLACQIQYYCAIRPGMELRLMRISWIDFDNRQIRIPNTEAKNNLTEIVEIPDFLFDEIKEYHLDRYDKDMFVFGHLGMPGKQALGKNTMRNRFNRYRDELGISPDKKFYSWKHTGAIDLIQNGAQPYDVMEHLRHKNFDTTEKYLKKRIKQNSRKINRFIVEI